MKRPEPIQPWVDPDGTGAVLRYRLMPCPPGMDSWVAYAWSLQHTGRDKAAAHYRAVPDACTDVVLDGQTGKAWFYGSLSQPVDIAITPGNFIFGIRLAPQVLPALAGQPAGAFQDAVPSLEELGLDALASTLRRQVEQGWNASWEGFWNELARQVNPARLPHRAGRVLEAAFDAAASGQVDVLSRSANLSARQLQRVVHEQVGLSPKRLLRILRFQQALRAVRDAPLPFTHIAAESGYADQAHMIREYVELSGESPGFWRERRRGARCGGDVRNLQYAPRRGRHAPV